jgi:hypothetical protein
MEPLNCQVAAPRFALQMRSVSLLQADSVEPRVAGDPRPDEVLWWR